MTRPARRAVEPVVSATLAVVLPGQVPYAALQGQRIERPRYSEQTDRGGETHLPLDYSRRATTSTQTEMGGAVDKQFLLPGGPLIRTPHAALKFGPRHPKNLESFDLPTGPATMNLDRFKADHDAIMVSVTHLRSLVRAGVANNAAEIARAIVSMSAKIKLHLSAEDASLYPHLAKSKNPRAVEMGGKLQAEMGHLATVYLAFANQWNIEAAIAKEPERFMKEASEVFTALATRIKLENKELYPMAEAA